jgi:hypothetical protein
MRAGDGGVKADLADMKKTEAAERMETRRKLGPMNPCESQGKLSLGAQEQWNTE